MKKSSFRHPRHFLCLLPMISLGLLPPIAAASDNPFETEPPKDSQERINLGVQITQLGQMRTLLVLDDTSGSAEKLVAQRLSDSQFRVFPSASIVTGRVDFEKAKALGTQGNADLVVVASAESREKRAMGTAQLFEGEATVQMFSPATGEIIVTQTTRTTGPRTSDAVAAERGAREAAVDLAVKEAIVKSLERAQKLIVHRVILTNVQDNTDLLAFMEHIAKMQGVYTVRRISWDPKSKDAEIEVIGSPQAESFWRAHIEQMPKVRIEKIQYVAQPPATSSGAQSDSTTPPDSPNVPNWMKN